MSSEQQVSTLDFPFCGKWEAITLHTSWEEKHDAVLTIKYNHELTFTKATLRVCIVRFPCLSVLVYLLAQ